jgi:hypothetical protein
MCACACACALSATALVQAQGEPIAAPHIALTWRAPEACPDEEAVRASVGRLLSGSTATVEGRAQATREGATWQVVLTMNGGERRLEGDSCYALAEATALIVAMAVDPERVVANRGAADAGLTKEADAGATATPLDGGPSPDAGPQPRREGDGGTPPSNPARDATTGTGPAVPRSPSTYQHAPSAPRHFAISAAAALDLGTLPGPAPGVALTAAWVPSRLRFELGASYFPSSSTATSPTGASATFFLVSGQARGCYVTPLPPFELAPCAGVEVALLQGTAQGIAFPTGGNSTALVALAPGLLADWHVAPAWAIFVRGDAPLELIRPEFQIDATTRHQPGFLTGRAALGVELRF